MKKIILASGFPVRPHLILMLAGGWLLRRSPCGLAVMLSSLLGGVEAFAQQVPLYSQYYFNPFIYNPALTGTAEQGNVFLTHRSQWNAIPGAPVTTALTIDGATKSKKVGLGASIYNHSSDLIQRSGINGFYSYRMDFSEVSKLNLGISIGILDNRIDFSKAIVKDADDPELLIGSQRKTAADADAGIAYMWKHTELGFAASHLTAAKIEYVSNDSRSVYNLSRNYLFSAKQTVYVNPEKNISLLPYLLFRFTPRTPMQYDINAALNWKDIAWAGISYRSNYCVSVGIRVKPYKSLSIGYTQDFITSKIGAYAGTSNELMLNYSFAIGSKAAEDPVMKKYLDEITSLSAKLQNLEEQLQKQNNTVKEDLKSLYSQIEQLKKETADSDAALKIQLQLLEEKVALLIKLIGE